MNRAGAACAPACFVPDTHRPNPSLTSATGKPGRCDLLAPGYLRRYERPGARTIVVKEYGGTVTANDLPARAFEAVIRRLSFP